MKQQIRIDLIPLYRTNFNSKYYLYKDNIKDEHTITLDYVDSILGSLSREFDIIQIRITGGEISLLSDLYFELLYEICKIYCKKIIVDTNFIELHKGIINCCDTINVLYNFLEGNNLRNVLANNIRIASSDKNINIKCYDVNCSENFVENINILNGLSIRSFEIIPYHDSLTTNYFSSYKSFESLVFKYLKYTNLMHFAFQNKLQLDNVLQIDNYNVKTVYLLPDNSIALRQFNKNNQVFFEKQTNTSILIKNIDEFDKKRDNFCKDCSYKLRCLANYFLNLNYTGQSCSGFKNLIKEYTKKDR